MSSEANTHASDSTNNLEKVSSPLPQEPFDRPRNEEEETSLSQLREALEPSSYSPTSLPDNEESTYFLSSDGTLLRFLRARKGKVQDATKMIHSTYKWRHENQPKSMVCPKCPSNPQAHCMRLVGWDKDGRPVLYFCYSLANDCCDSGANVKHLIELLEKSIEMMDKRGGSDVNPSGKWVVIVDFAGYALKHNNPKTAVGFAKTLDHYPERMGLCLLVNAPTIFSVVWAAASRVLDPVTTEKIRFLSCNTAAEEKWKPDFEANLGKEMANWLTNEIKENAMPENKLTKKYWEWLDEDGKGKSHDSRGFAPYVKSQYFMSYVNPKFCKSASMEEEKSDKDSAILKS